MPKDFRNQNYMAIKTRCFKAGQLWEDEDFPANTKSLFYTKVDNTIEWKRPKELCKAPKLIVDNVTVDDLQVGELNNHWFVSACMCLARDKSVWTKVIPAYTLQDFQAPAARYAGIFRFFIWRYGEWISVCVDDRLPCRNNKLVFVHSAESHEFWTSLLEKAYTKLFGDYESMSHGHAIDALVDFTGGVAERVDIQTIDVEDEKTFSDFFHKLRDGIDHRAQIMARLDCADEDVGKPNDEGLLLGHWYCITAAHELEMTIGLEGAVGGKHFKMVRLFNPCDAVTQYTGPWANGSPEWMIASRQEWERMGIRYVLEHEFWMSFKVFTAQFVHLDMCHFLNTSFFSLGKPWNEAVFHGQWTGNGRTGGSDYQGPTVLANPQFMFDVTAGADCVVVAIEQHDMKGREALYGKMLTLGFHIMKVEDNRAYRAHIIGERWFSSDYRDIRAAFGSVKLWKGRYIILPTTFTLGLEGKFMLRLYTTNKANAVELKEDIPTAGFCRPVYKMVTMIKVLKCEGLTLPPNIKQCDPKVVIRCEGQVVRSGFKQNTVNPEFTVAALFYRRNPAMGIVIEVWHNKNILDYFLGQGVFSEEAPLEGKKFTLELYGRKKEIAMKKGGTMEIFVKCSTDLSTL